MTQTTTLTCGHEPSAHSETTTGYGTNDKGETFCYECCAKNDREQMARDGRTTLYLVKNAAGSYEVTNWPGSLRFATTEVRKGRHNIAGSRFDAWFRGPEGALWHAVNIGDNDIARCRRTKAGAR